MDTTTLHTACVTLMGAPGHESEATTPGKTRNRRWRRLDTTSPSFFINGFTLLDLDNFVRCAVLYDSVFCLGGLGSVGRQSAEALNAAIGKSPIIMDIPIPDLKQAPRGPNAGPGGVAGVLNDLIETVGSDIRGLFKAVGPPPFVDDANAFVRAWREVFGAHSLSKELLVEQLPGPGAKSSVSWASYGPALLEEALKYTQERYVSLGDSEALAKLAGECSIRSLFNARVGRILGLPYSPNSVRFPFWSRAIANAVVAQRVFADIEYVEWVLRKQAAEYLQPAGIQLPALLTVILERVSKLEQIPEAIANLRFEATSYRERRRDLLMALRDGNIKEMGRLKRALEEDAKNWTEAIRAAPLLAIHGTVLGALAGTGGILPTIAALLAIIAVYEKLPEKVRDAMNRTFFRPSEYFVYRIADACRTLGDATGKVQRLWSLTDHRVKIIRDQLKRFMVVNEAQIPNAK